MKPSAKAKWVIGLSGIAFSAFIVGQLDAGGASDTNMLPVEMNDSMSKHEKELVKLDWSDFTVQVTNEGDAQSDRITRKSKRG